MKNMFDSTHNRRQVKQSQNTPTLEKGAPIKVTRRPNKPVMVPFTLKGLIARI